MMQPGQFVDFAQLDALNTQRDTLNGQLAGARTLGQPSGRKYNTVGGAFAGGAGDVLGAIAGKTQEAKYANALAENAKQRQAMLGAPGPAAPPAGY